MSDHAKKIAIPQQDNDWGVLLANQLSKRGFTVQKTNSMTMPIVVFLFQERYEIDEKVSHILQSVSANEPIFVIRVTDKVVGFPELKKRDLSIIEIDLHAARPTLFQSDTSSSSEQKTINVELVSEMIEKYIANQEKLSPTIGVVGLGYVGLPVAVGFSKKYRVIGFDINKEKVAGLKRHHDVTGEHLTHELQESNIEFTNEEHRLKQCDYIIVAVPTPINRQNEPDLSYLEHASAIIGRQLKPYTTVVYESTVFPITTERVCLPILEAQSNLVAGTDFHIGYSPERLNPGDQKHTFEKNSKVVSGQNDYALEKIYSLYKSVINAPIYKAPSIQVAEAAKIVENAQRDINIAFMNELAMTLDALNIDTNEVLQAARTKWNFQPYSPGLVGGHCIGVDSYYLIHRAMRSGFYPSFLSEARKINDHMPAYIVSSLLENMAHLKEQRDKVQVTVLGVAFKENIADVRNSKAVDIIHLLQQEEFAVQVNDPYVAKQGNDDEVRFPLQTIDQLEKAHVVVLAVPHDCFAYETASFWEKLLKDTNGIVMDIKGVIPRDILPKNIIHWTL